jgi:antitoxin PrlF
MVPARVVSGQTLLPPTIGQYRSVKKCRREEEIVAESTVNLKGQTTVPAGVRASLNVQPGTRLLWHVMLDGTVIVRVKSKSIRGLAGSLKTDKHVDIEDMNPWRS